MAWGWSLLSLRPILSLCPLIDQLVFLHDLAHTTLRIIKINLIVGFALTHSLGIVLALMLLITPIQAALFHAVPDFLILFNASRLISFKGRRR